MAGKKTRAIKKALKIKRDPEVEATPSKAELDPFDFDPELDVPPDPKLVRDSERAMDKAVQKFDAGEAKREAARREAQEAWEAEIDARGPDGSLSRTMDDELARDLDTKQADIDLTPKPKPMFGDAELAIMSAPAAVGGALATGGMTHSLLSGDDAPAGDLDAAVSEESEAPRPGNTDVQARLEAIKRARRAQGGEPGGVGKWLTDRVAGKKGRSLGEELGFMDQKPHDEDPVDDEVVRELDSHEEAPAKQPTPAAPADPSTPSKLAKTQPTGGGAPRTKGPLIKLDTESQGKLDTALVSFEQALAKYPPADEDAFANELKALNKTFAQAKTDLEARELAHTLAEGLTQMGAAWAGMKTGTDMSALKFKEHNFQKDLELLQNELQMKLGDLRARREEDFKKRSKAADMAMEQTKFKYAMDKDTKDRDLKRATDEAQLALGYHKANVDAAGHAATARYHDAMIEIAKEKNADERAHKMAESKRKLISDVAENATKALRDPESKGRSEDDRVAAAMAAMGQLNLPPELVEAKFKKEGLIYGTNMIDAKDVGKAITELVAEHEARGNQFAPGYTARSPVDGKLKSFPTAQARDEAIALWNKK